MLGGVDVGQRHERGADVVGHQGLAALGAVAALQVHPFPGDAVGRFEAREQTLSFVPEKSAKR